MELGKTFTLRYLRSARSVFVAISKSVLRFNVLVLNWPWGGGNVQHIWWLTIRSFAADVRQLKAVKCFCKIIFAGDASSHVWFVLPLAHYEIQQSVCWTKAHPRLKSSTPVLGVLMQFSCFCLQHLAWFDAEALLYTVSLFAHWFEKGQSTCVLNLSLFVIE